MAAEQSGPGTAGAGLMDLSLAGMAQAAGVETGYLETVNEQLDIFFGRDMELWLEDLRELMDPAKREEAKVKLGMVLSVCRQGDWTDVLAFLEEERSDDPDWEQALLLERNQNWVPLLEEFFARGEVFVAAGAGHLIAPGNVLELLEARGYTVRQMQGATVPREQLELGGTDASGAPRVPRETFVELMGLQLSPLLCAAGSRFMRCFGEETARCAEELVKALEVCPDQVGLPEFISGPEGRLWAEKLGECIGVETYGGLSDVLVEGPSCPASVEAGVGEGGE
jgi:hypothetical protein